jgi:subtilisin family serine protease
MSSVITYAIKSATVLITLLLCVNNVYAVAEYIPGEILVKFKDTSPSRSVSINSIHSYVGSLKKKKFKKLKIHHVKLPDGLSVEEAVQLYQQDPNVEYAEPNYIVHATATLPDDTSFSQLWGLDNTGQTVNSVTGTADADIDAPEAWDDTTGSPNVVVAVVDTGVTYDHPDLTDNIWTNTPEITAACTDDIDNNANGIVDDCDECGDSIDNDGNGYIDDCYGWDFLSDDNDPMDFTDHGTHVAGTIAAVGNNAVGISGVMWQAQIMPLRFLGIDGNGSTADAVEAILYANANGAHIINNSWGGGGFSRTLKDAIDASNTTIVFAAGNGGSDETGDNNDSFPFYPASYTSANIISVAATHSSDDLTTFSNFGVNSVDLAAPGKNIYSTIPARETIFNDNFNDNDLKNDGWTTGGTHDDWAVSNDFGRLSMTDRPSADYRDNTNTWSQAPVFSLAGKTGCKVTYMRGLTIQFNDFLHVEASIDQASWTILNSYTGIADSGFREINDDLTGFDGQPAVYIRFRLESDASSTAAGAYIDDVDVNCYASTYAGTEYDFKQGTSMATPHVSGVAGLILSQNAALANYQIKALILNNVDPKGLQVLTGGRLNADDAVSNAATPETPTGLTVTGVSSASIDLSWTDNSSNESGFKIERKTIENGLFSELASVGADITTYGDSNISLSTTYYYRVRAFGGSLGSFEHSNEVTATTATPVSTGGGGGGGGGGGCFIATAAYGSPLHPYVKELRSFRDAHLLTNQAGKAFVRLYYLYSPPLAEVIKGNDKLRFAARIMLAPLVMTVAYPYLALSLFTALIIGSLVICRRKRQ